MRAGAGRVGQGPVQRRECGEGALMGGWRVQKGFYVLYLFCYGEIVFSSGLGGLFLVSREGGLNQFVCT